MKLNKSNALKSTANVSGPSQMPLAMQKKLDQMTINEAIASGIVTDLGDAKGQFFFAHADDTNTSVYGIVNGHYVKISDKLKDLPKEQIDSCIGDLRFSSGLSLDKYKNGEKDPTGDFVPWFRLGLPAGIRLGEAVYTMEPTEVESK